MPQTASHKRPRIEGVAYAGGPIQLSGWRQPVVVDLAGMTIPDAIPLLTNHENRTQARVGSIRARVENGTLLVAGEITAKSPEAQNVIEQGDWQLSIGAEAVEYRDLKAGQKIVANGREHVGPLTLVAKSILREVSIVAVGADAESFAHIAAGTNLAAIFDLKGNSMSEESNVAPATIEAAASTPDAIRAEAAKVERERIAGIRTVCNGEFPDIEREAIDGDWSKEAAAQEILKRLRASRPEADPRVAAWSASRPSGQNSSSNDILAHLFVRAGCPELGVQTVGEPAIAAVQSRGPARFIELARRCLITEGNFMRSNDNDEDIVRAAFSSVMLPGVLNAFVRRNLEQAYSEAPSVWRTFCAVRSVPDFRENVSYRLSSMEPLAKVAPGGEIAHGTLTDEPVVRYAADSFGMVLTLDRRMVLNDDLSAFAEIARLMGVSAGRTLDDLVWGAILSNSDNHFSPANGNMLSGADSILNEESLGRAITKLMCQKDKHGRVIGMDAHVLVVPPEQLFAAKKLLESDFMNTVAGNLPDGVMNVPAKNVLRNSVQLACEPRISQMDHKNASASKWFLFARPIHIPAVTAFLDGRQTPTVKTLGIDENLNHLAYSWRVYHDFGFSLGDPRAAVMSVGK